MRRTGHTNSFVRSGQPNLLLSPSALAPRCMSRPGRLTATSTTSIRRCSAPLPRPTNQSLLVSMVKTKSQNADLGQPTDHAHMRWRGSPGVARLLQPAEPSSCMPALPRPLLVPAPRRKHHQVCNLHTEERLIGACKTKNQQI